MVNMFKLISFIFFPNYPNFNINLEILQHIKITKAIANVYYNYRREIFISISFVTLKIKNK